MRQIQKKQRELTLRFFDTGQHGLSHALVILGRLGVILLLVGLWLGIIQTPLPALVLTVIGSFLIVVRKFVPRLYPEVATCTFNKTINRLTVVHEIPGRRGRSKFRDRNVTHYQISDIRQINVYRSRKSFFGATYTLLIEMGRQTGRQDLISIDSVHDQVILQRGNAPVQLLAKEIDYHLGRRINVAWTYVTVPEGINQKRLGRRVAIRQLRRRTKQPDIHQIASTIETFIRMP